MTKDGMGGKSVLKKWMISRGVKMKKKWSGFEKMRKMLKGLLK